MSENKEIKDEEVKTAEQTKNTEETQSFNEDEFLKKVEKAARKGAKQGGVWGFVSQILPPILIIIMFLVLVLPKFNAFNQGMQSLFHFDNGAEGNDLVLDNNGIFGYTAANFEEAILGDSEKLKKIEVYQQEVSDVVTVTDTGFINWSAFTKTKMITYNGTVVYTVDLSKLARTDIVFNEDEHIITLLIPHAVQEEINIPEDKIEFGTTEGGLLAFGELKLTPEQTAQVQAGAREKMEKKLEEQNAQETADRFAKLTVWEMYSPIIKGVAKDYSLEVEFK